MRSLLLSYYNMSAGRVSRPPDIHNTQVIRYKVDKQTGKFKTNKKERPSLRAVSFPSYEQTSNPQPDKRSALQHTTSSPVSTLRPLAAEKPHSSGTANAMELFRPMADKPNPVTTEPKSTDKDTAPPKLNKMDWLKATFGGNTRL